MKTCRTTFRISGGNREVLAIRDALLEWASAPQSQLSTVVGRAVKRAQGIQVETMEDEATLMHIDD